LRQKEVRLKDVQVIPMSRNLNLLGGAIALLAILLAAVFFVTLSSPTPAPLQESLDYLKVVRALSGVQSRVEAQKSSSDSPTLLPDISEAERRQILQQAGGLIRQVNLRPDGAIAVQAVNASVQQNDSTPSASVRLLLVPERVGEKYDWHCFGEPVSALPTFCGNLQ
jgi:hypothetical protein